MAKPVARKAKKAAGGAQSEAAAEPPIGSALATLFELGRADHSRRGAVARELRHGARNERGALVATLAEHVAAMLSGPENEEQLKALRAACNALESARRTYSGGGVVPPRITARREVCRASWVLADHLAGDVARARRETKLPLARKHGWPWNMLRRAVRDLRAADPENTGAADVDAFESTVREMVGEMGLPRTTGIPRTGEPPAPAERGERDWRGRVTLAALRFLAGFSPDAAKNVARAIGRSLSEERPASERSLSEE